MNGNLIASIHKDDIMSIKYLEDIEADDTKLCCFAVSVVRCIAPGHSLSSLLADVTLQHCVWIVAILALIFNIVVGLVFLGKGGCVIIAYSRKTRENRKHPGDKLGPF